MRNLEQKYNQWCKDTKRNGGIITGESLREFFAYCNSIPVPSVEGYLEGKLRVHDAGGETYRFFDESDVIAALQILADEKDMEINAALETISFLQKQNVDALTALRALKEDCEGEIEQLHKDLDTVNKTWWPLASIAVPEKWTKVYEHYQELLQRKDVAGFWHGEFEKMRKQKEELQAEVERLRGIIKEYQTPDVYPPKQ